MEDYRFSSPLLPNSNNLWNYLLLSSLHNRGAGCGGTSPLVVPFAVYLVDEGGIENRVWTFVRFDDAAERDTLADLVDRLSQLSGVDAPVKTDD